MFRKLAGKLSNLKSAIEEEPQEQKETDLKVDEIVKRLRGSGQSAPVASKKTAKVKTESLGKVGNIYAALENPLNALSGVITLLPVSQTLKSDLEASGAKYTPENYIALCTTTAFVFAILSFFIMAIITAAFGDGSASSITTGLAISITMALLGFAGGLALTLSYPAMQANSKAALIDKELPFALRQLSTQVKAGVSFTRALKSIGDTNYGVLTVEIKKTLSDMDGGLSTIEALRKLATRNKSQGLQRAVTQISRALRTGGNLSEIISTIADDVSFETRMKIRDYTELLNLISIVYIMIAVVAPVMVTILAAVTQLPVFGGGIAFGLILGVFIGIASITCALVYVIKKAEPTG